ncbi:MAG: lysylphosphatidylglycerol synthase transmembrane domain-containing protein [Ginsengibacter sp.]
MNKIKPRNLLKLFLKLGFTAILLYFVLRKINFEEIKKIFQRSNPVFIFVAFLVFFLSQIVSSWRLLSFLNNIGLSLKFWFNFRLYLLGMFYNIFLPGGIGGDGYKIYLLHKKFQSPVKKIFSALFFDRLSGLWAVAFTALIFLFFVPENIFPMSWIILIFIAACVIYYVVLHKYFRVFSRHFFANHLKAIVVQTLQVVSVALILLAINFKGNFAPYLFIFLVSSVVSIIPFTIGGLGAREYVMIYAALILSIDKNVGVFISAAFWLISALVSLAGAYYAYRSREFKSAPLKSAADVEETGVA